VALHWQHDVAMPPFLVVTGLFINSCNHCFNQPESYISCQNFIKFV